MTSASLAPSDVVVTALTLLIGLVGGGSAAFFWFRRHRKPEPSGRVLLALPGPELLCDAIDAAARIGRADNAIVAPAMLVSTPYRLPLDKVLPDTATEAMEVLEVVEKRLLKEGVQVDCRIVQGRTVRHALRRLVAEERFDRLVVPAGESDGAFSAADIGWLLGHIDGEVMVLRSARDQTPPELEPRTRLALR